MKNSSIERFLNLKNKVREFSKYDSARKNSENSEEENIDSDNDISKTVESV